MACHPTSTCRVGAERCAPRIGATAQPGPSRRVAGRRSPPVRKTDDANLSPRDQHPLPPRARSDDTCLLVKETNDRMPQIQRTPVLAIILASYLMIVLDIS